MGFTGAAFLASLVSRVYLPVVLGHGMLVVLGGFSPDVGRKHPTRSRILAHLNLLPGDHFRSIARMLGLGVGSARHHLDVLLDDGLVRADKTRGKVRYYASGAGSNSERNQLFAKHWNYRDLRLRVLYATKQLHKATPATVARSLGISRQLAAYHLSSLVELGLVKRENGRYHA